MPDYRSIFADRLAPFLKKEQSEIRKVMPDDRIHLAEDRAFFIERSTPITATKTRNSPWRFNGKSSTISFPGAADLIHCNDWMTALIPAMSRRLGIPCLFTIHNIHTVEALCLYRRSRH
jgi:starch synthase/alpha-amylase